MKITSLLLLVSLLQINANVKSQTRISLKAENATIKEVFTEIEKVSDFRFLYHDGLTDLNKLITLNVDKENVIDILNQLFSETHSSYKVLDNNLIVVVPVTANYQKQKVTGTVTDAVSGEPLIGVNIVLKGTTIGVITDVDGKFSIDIPDLNSVLVVSSIGYATAEFPVNNQAVLNLSLQPETKQLEEIVVVGYGTQKRATVTGSVSNVKGDEIIKAPVVNVTNSLVGRLPGLVAVNKSGEPGADGSTLRIRGVNTLNNNDPLIVVDGVAGRGMERLNPADIESITILKDASAAIYGAQAANGVILITTKRGKVGKPTVSLNLNTGFNSPTRIPKMADAATYATMMNEVKYYADKGKGMFQLYSEDEIQKFRDGSDPLRYPNTNWFDEVFEKRAPQSSANITINGGSENLKYFLSLGAKSQDGIYKNSATKYTQYNFRSNIDGKITKHIYVSFDVSGRQENKNYPTRAAGEIFRFLMRGKPNMIARWPNGLPGPDIEYGDNPVVVATSATGYDKDKWYILESNLKLNVEIPWVKGLSLTGNASFDKNFQNHKVWRTPWFLYGWNGTDFDSNNQPVLTKSQRGFSSPELQQNFLDRQNITANLLLNYETKLFNDHDIKIMLGSERFTKDEYQSMAFRKYFVSSAVDQIFAGGEKDMNNDGNQLYSARLNYFGRVNYNFREKYLAEFVWRYDGSYIFKGGEKQFGFFPGVSLGWRISEENFFKNNVSFIDNFKLRASWGQTGNDRIDEYQYLAAYGIGDRRYSWANNYTYIFNENVENKILYEKQTPNPGVTWEIANQSNIGFETSFLNNRLSFEADYFYNKRSQILIYRNASIPAYTGLTLPRENLGKVSNKGFEGVVAFRDKAGDFSYEISVNGGYSKNKVDFWDETPGKPTYQQITGHPIPTDVTNVDDNLYYQAIGIFQDDNQINSTPHWAGAQPGDIIFKDVNGDNKIDALDRVRDYRTAIPTFTGGMTLNFGFKQFDLSILLQGASGAVRYISTESGEIGNYLQDFAENRWTPDNPSTSDPRTFNRSNDYWVNQRNTYWLRSTNYIRLKNIEFGYTTPAKFNTYFGIQGLRVYFSGLNLLTLDKLKVYDPESDSNSGQIYPLNKVVNAGLTLTF